ncbi:MAG TPA: ABC transporter ATP-binding protein [Syntrophorhabdaceae bacterium]|jgi:NitT/TauT family transport system ATP-binding protein
MAKIVLDGVRFSYGSQEVLRDVALCVDQGDFLCIVGPSGAGKSSLLRLIAGLATPSSGSITIDGKYITGAGLDRGVVFQDYTLFPWMTAGENILLALKQAYPAKETRELKGLGQDFLELVGLPEVYDRFPGELSGGMRQRVAIARVFAADPPILLMDEPFGALDAVTRIKLQDLLINLWQREKGQSKTVVFVTHDVEEALILANRIAVVGINPGVIKEVCEVTLPRPRIRQSLFSNRDFLALRGHLVEVLHDEILNQVSRDQVAFPGGDKI